MTPADRIRFHLIRARRSADAAAVPGLLAEALVAERHATGAATERRLTEHYGFTGAELATHARAALDRATERWIGYCEPRRDVADKAAAS